MTASIADADKMQGSAYSSDFIWDFEMLSFPELLENWEKKSAKIHEIGKIKAIFGFRMIPI